MEETERDIVELGNRAAIVLIFDNSFAGPIAGHWARYAPTLDHLFFKPDRPFRWTQWSP